MYPSNSSSSFNGNINDLISYPIQPLCSRPFSTESNPTSKDQETNCALLPPPHHPSLSFFHFPCSPFEDNEIFPQHHHDDDLLDLQHHHHHHHQSLAPPPHEAAAGVVNMEVSITTTAKAIPPNKSTTTTHHDQQQIPMRRRSSKRDRHSKINTAKGLRDRRMRLSLDVAKRFFGLQDMLGFDKASKTVEWLLNQAKVEIKQLAREKNIHPSCSSVGAKSASSTSECEGVSSLDEVAVSGNQGQEGDETKAVPIPTTTTVKRRTNNRLSRKSAFNPIGKESREKARARARERASERARERARRLGVVDEESKANKQCNNNEAIITNHSLSRLGSWNPFEMVEESQIRVNPSLDVLAREVEERSSQAKDQHLGCVDQDLAHDDSFVIMSRWSPAMILNSLNNPGNLQEHQFAEFQSMGKTWEAYNNHV